MSETIYVRFARIGDGKPYAIGKWSETPIEGGVRYIAPTPVEDAAPELLAALKSIVRVGRLGLDDFDMQRAELAIAKATQP